MAQPKWLEKYLHMKPEVSQIYEHLDQYREFCVEFGHVFDERDLYNERSYSFQDFQRHLEGKHVKNRWFARNDERKEWKPRNNNGGYRGNNNYRSGGYRNNA